jgi:hypothetical protein
LDPTLLPWILLVGGFIFVVYKLSSQLISALAKTVEDLKVSLDGMKDEVKGLRNSIEHSNEVADRRLSILEDRIGRVEEHIITPK